MKTITKYPATILTMAFTSLLFLASGQDTLDCKKDLKYDAKGKFYYKKGDEAKTPASGNAVCHPKRGMVNRGKIVNGKWDGRVTGYKDNRVVGYSNYKNGLLDGLKLCYADNGKAKDSTIYNDGMPVYSYTVDYKSGKRTQTMEKDYVKNTTVYTHYDRVNDMEYVSKINRMRGDEKDGFQEYMRGESEAAGSLFTYTYQEEKYDNGELKTVTYYNKGAKYKVNDYADGKLSIQNDIGPDGNIAASYPLRKGKKHGTAVIYSAKGEKPVSQEYSRGKLVKSK